LLEVDADRANLELPPLLKDRALVHPFAGNGGSWRKAACRACPFLGARNGRAKLAG
jgi:hypothetical protein